MSDNPEYVKIPAWYYHQLKQERDQQKVHLAELAEHYAYIVDQLSPVIGQMEAKEKPGYMDIISQIGPLLKAMQSGGIDARLKQMHDILKDYTIPDDPEQIAGDTQADTQSDAGIDGENDPENPDS